VSILSDALLSVVKQQVLKAIVSQIPTLGAPLLNPILALIVDKILRLAFASAALEAYFIKVDLMTQHQAKLVSEAQTKLDQAKTDQEKKDAEIELKKRLNDLIIFKP
jgi:hypothetical protein